MNEISNGRQLSHAELRKVYEAQQNVMRFCKEILGSGVTNEQAAIMHAYELQAGSYIKRMQEDADYRAKKECYGRAVAKLIEGYAPRSILEAGVGESTTLAELLNNFPANVGEEIYAFDLSWSRVMLGQKYLIEKTGRRDCRLFAGELEHIAMPDNSFDLVYTSHAIEPNHGREAEILEELYRVTAGHLVLIEPAYELADAAARERMEYHGYCRGLKNIAETRGWNVVRHELFEGREEPSNPTMLLVIEKGAKTAPRQFVSPIGHGPLELKDGHYFNRDEGLVFPVIGGVPYLTTAAGLLASHYCQA